MKTWETKSGYKIIRILSDRSNAFIIDKGTGCMMVDTGRKMKWAALLKRLNSLNVEQIDLLVLTHSHFDHVENAWRMKELYRPRILLHQHEAGYLGCGDSPLPQGTMVVTRMLLKMFARFYQARVKYPGVACDIEIGARLDLQPWGYNAYILHTPGHTAGSISLIVDDEIALVGDAMVGQFKTTIFQPFADDVETTVISWKKLLDTGCQLFLPAHGGVINRQQVFKDYERYRRKFSLASSGSV